MKQYLEKCLRRGVEIRENKELLNRLPLKYAGCYEIFTARMEDIEWIILRPKMEIRLNTLRHDQKQVQKVSGLNCAYFFTNISHYAKEVMMDEGIPFVIENRQLYLPFIGMLMSEKNDRKLTPVHTISFLTQKLLLCALYEKWENMNATKIAEKLNVTKMSVTRCLDEIEYLGVDMIDTSGKYRKITVGKDTKTLWKEIQPILRNPVIIRYELVDDLNLTRKAGISALSEYSLLGDNQYPTYGITKKELKSLNLKEKRQAAWDEEKGCVVLELGYFIDFQNKNLQDPLSVLMSMTREEQEDERVQISVEEMLEEYVW